MLGCKDGPGGGEESQESRRALRREFGVNFGAMVPGGGSQEPGATMGQQEGPGGEVQEPRIMVQEEVPGGMTQEVKATSFSVLFNYIKARQGKEEMMQMLIVVCC